MRLKAYKNDCVEKFWLGNSYSSMFNYTSAEGGKITVTTSFEKWTGAGSSNSAIETTLASITAKVNEIDAHIDKTSRLTTVESIHNEISTLCSYYPDKAHIPDTADIRNIATAFTGSSPHYVVCEGFAKSFKYLCDKYDVPCILVSGWGYQDASDRDTHLQNDANRHMWNMVQMEDGKWYLVDVTWDDNDDGVMQTKYLLKGSTSTGYSALTLDQDHEVDPELKTAFNIPDVAAGNYDEITATFLDYDGSIIWQQHFSYNDDLIGYPATASFADAKIGTFTFTGWNATIPAKITESIVFRAQYNIDYTHYTVTFKNGSTTVSTHNDLIYGADLVIPANPTKNPTNDTVFTFKGWSTDGTNVVTVPAKVSGNVEYKAVYEESIRYYTITFLDHDGAKLSEQSLTFGSSITAPANPTRPADEYYIYTFSNWAPAVPATVNDASFDYTFTAVYTSSLNIQEINGSSFVKVKENSVKFNTSEMADIKSRPGSLSIEFPNAKIKFDHNAVMGLAADEVLQIIKKDTNSIPENLRADHRKAVVYDIDFGANNNAFTSGTAVVSIDTKTSEPDKLELFWVNGSEMVPLEFEYKNHQVVFSTNHFSIYAIDGIKDDESDPIEFLIPIFIILIIAAIGMALAYKFS